MQAERIYSLDSQALSIDLGSAGEASVFSSVPFVCDEGTQYAAHELHAIRRGRRWVVLQALNGRRQGTVKVSLKGSPRRRPH